MRVVFLSQRVPFPPDRGDRITTHHFLRHLLGRGCEVFAGCFREEPDDDVHAATLARDVRELCAPRISRRWRKLASLRGLLRGQPLTLPFFAHRGLARTVARWVELHRPDLVWVYSSGMAQFAMPHAGPLRLMQFAELDSDKWRQFATRATGAARRVYAREARLLLRYETQVARTFDVSAVVSDVEKTLFEQSIPGVTPSVLPNGVDVEQFAVGDPAAREPHTAIFTGVMDYEPNVDGVLWFVRECWPAVRQRVPDARLLVVGSRPVAAILGLHDRDGIEVTGRVPAIPPWLHRASVAIAPLRLARGVQNKVLEAMSTGLPVVATAQAAQGLGPSDAAPGVVVANDSDATVSAVTGFLLAPARAQAEGARAAAHVRARFLWEHMFARADAAIDAARARRQNPH